MMMTAPNAVGKGLRALDADLPFLAAEAAVDIDNLLTDGGTLSESVLRLAELLRQSVDVGTGSTPKSLMDPATLSVLGEAIELAQRPSEFTTTTLLVEAAKIAEELSAVGREHPPAALESARDFCVALSIVSAAYHKSIFDLHPPHPSRR